MHYPFRPEVKKSLKRVVIKLGSLCVTKPDGGLRLAKIRQIVKDISFLKESGLDVVLVSSGAINAGRSLLDENSNSSPSVSQLQAASAIGQPLLMHAYQVAFRKYKLITAQVLLTHDDIKNKTRYLNLKNTFDQLLSKNIIPIVNENDSVSFEEITLGDNDQLAAMVCEIVQAGLLCFLSEADGLFDGDPNKKNSQPIPLIPYDKNFDQIKVFKKSSAGKGGILTKIQAIQKVTPLGTSVVLSSYKPAFPIKRALNEHQGSFFEPAQVTLPSQKKSRILTRVRNHAFIQLDEGAFHAVKKHASILPIGIKSVKGSFHRGDSVAVKFKNKIFAYGISEYDSKEILKIMGQKSDQISKILGFAPSSVIIHRNNLILKEKT